MRKLFLAFLISTFFCISPLYAEKEERVLFYDSISKELVGSMSLKNFKNLCVAADIYLKMIDAEENKRIKVILKNKIWKPSQNEDFVTDMRIVWVDKKGKILKDIVIEIKFDNLRKNMKKESKLLKIYGTTAKVGFPITLLLVILCILL